MDYTDMLDGHLRSHANQSLAHLQDIRDDTESEKNSHQRSSTRVLHLLFDCIRRAHRVSMANARHDQAQGTLRLRAAVPTHSGHTSIVVFHQIDIDGVRSGSKWWQQRRCFGVLATSRHCTFGCWWLDSQDYFSRLEKQIV